MDKKKFEDTVGYIEAIRVCQNNNIPYAARAKCVKIAVGDGFCCLYPRKGASEVRATMDEVLRGAFSRINKELYYYKNKSYKPNPGKIDPTPFVSKDNIESFVRELCGITSDRTEHVPNSVGSNNEKLKRDTSKLTSYFERFVEYVHDNDNNELPIDFCERDGILKREENYKSVDVVKARTMLGLNGWKESLIGTGEIGGRVLKAIGKCYNLVDNHSQTKLRNMLDVTHQSYKPEAEKALYCIYEDDNEKEAFEYARKVLGGIYDLIACLFFIKDENRFLPIKTDNFDKRFNLLGIDYKTSGRCSWENYVGYINIIREIGNELTDSISLAHSVRLLDAHSFVWIIGEKKFLDWVPNRMQCIEESEQLEKEIQEKKIGDGKEAYSYVKTRINQGAYRKELLKRYHSCVLCKMGFENALIASHIKPWSVSKKEEKTDCDNGFMLCPNHDKLFDSGYISFDDLGRILISDQLNESDRLLLNVHSDMKIRISEGNKKYLKYHRSHLFQKGT